MNFCSTDDKDRRVIVDKGAKKGIGKLESLSLDECYKLIEEHKKHILF